MDRKEFIKKCGSVCLGCLGIVLTLESCKTVSYIPHSVSGNRIVAKKSDIADQKFVLLKTEKLEAPIYLRKVSDNEYTALHMLCTHKGCELNASGDYLVCPCHGSEFSPVGQVLQGPAEENLQTFKVSSDTDYIYISL